MRCPDGPDRCLECAVTAYLTPAQRCRDCGFGCAVCKDSRTCTQCADLSLLRDRCVRCSDPRCADCSGNLETCRRCSQRGFEVNRSTGRCEAASPRMPSSSRAAGLPSRDDVVQPAIVGGRNATRGR